MLQLGVLVQSQRRWGVPTLLLGDLNIEPDSLERALLGLLVPGLVDAWRSTRRARPLFSFTHQQRTNSCARSLLLRRTKNGAAAAATTACVLQQEGWW